jgi:uncharacterized protein (DUF433 family)
MNNNVCERYMVSDPKICHGKPTFKDTRIMVSQVREQITNGLAWETIKEWRGSIKEEAIAEAVKYGSNSILTG